MTRRTLINLFVFLGLSLVLIVYVALSLLYQGGGKRTLSIEFADATGVSIRNDVTMRGVPAGIVSDIQLTPSGTAVLEISLDEGKTVPEGTKAELTRRSAIGDVTLELTPGSGSAIPNRGKIPMSDTRTPPDPERTIEILARVLHSVPSQDLSTVVSELATAVRDRGPDLATLSEASADLPEALLKVKGQLESLILNGPKVTGVLAANSDTLADDLALTAQLTDILRDERFDLRDLSENGARFAQVAADLIVKDKANLACLISDLGVVNATLAEPEHLADLERTLENNHFFFDGVWQAVQHGLDGLDWFRVQLVFPPGQPHGNEYEPNRPSPDVFAGNACRSIYGDGVGPGNQRLPVHLAPGSTLHPGR
jgi:phospholipid/cholesterol/gamma-HCH transport system substrate-binding protein